MNPDLFTKKYVIAIHNEFAKYKKEVSELISKHENLSERYQQLKNHSHNLEVEYLELIGKTSYPDYSQTISTLLNLLFLHMRSGDKEKSSDISGCQSVLEDIHISQLLQLLSQFFLLHNYNEKVSRELLVHSFDILTVLSRIPTGKDMIINNDNMIRQFINFMSSTNEFPQIITIFYNLMSSQIFVKFLYSSNFFNVGVRVILKNNISQPQFLGDDIKEQLINILYKILIECNILLLSSIDSFSFFRCLLEDQNININQMGRILLDTYKKNNKSFH